MRTAYLAQDAASAASPAAMQQQQQMTAAPRAPASASPGVRPVYAPDNAPLAGEKNKPGGVFDRLSRPENFSGVYRKRFEGHGRINSDTSTTNYKTSYKGS